jgi:hypothetical protein
MKMSNSGLKDFFNRWCSPGKFTLRSYRVRVGLMVWLTTLGSAQAADPTLSVTNSLQLWLKADSGVTTNATGNITSWADQSGQANNAAQSDTTKAPTFVDNVLNGKPVIRFDGSNDYLEVADAPSIEITGDITSFAVIMVKDYANYNGIWGKTANNLPAPTDWYLVQGSGISRVYRGDGTTANLGNADSDRAIRAGAYLILAFEMTGTNLNQYLNGFPVGSGHISATLGDAGTALRIGSRDDLVTKLKGDMAELLIYNTALSDSDRNTVFDYLKNKYGLQNLPPTASVSAPANNATFTAPANLIVTAKAADQDGTVSRVDFVANGRIFASATAAPYSVPVTLATPGTITLTAVATDDKDASTTSTPVQITVTGGIVPTYTPSSSLKVWLKADTGITTNASGAVTGWKDQTGNHNDASQADDTKAPLLAANVANSQPALSYDGSQQYLEIQSNDSIVMTNDITSFFVVEFDDFATYRSVWGKTSSNVPRPTDYYALPSSGVARFYRGNDTGLNDFVDSAAGLPANQFLIAGFTHSNPTATHWLNGSAYGSGTMNLPTSDDGTSLKIGTRDDFVTQLKGKLAELLIYNTVVSPDERQSLTTYLATKYGLPLVYNDNQAPSVTLTSTAPSTVSAPADVTLQATANDTDGSVVNVVFYGNGTQLASATAKPYTLSAHIATPGPVTFTAIATDNLGLTSTSGPVVVTATGAASTMSVTDGLQLWLKADAGVSTNADGTVSAWADQSGHSNNAIQADPTLAPSLISGAVNSEPVVRFDGSTRYLDIGTGGVTLLNDLSSFFVIRCDDFSNYRAVWAQTSANRAAPNDYYLNAGSGIPTFNRGDGVTVGGFSGLNPLAAGNYAVLGFDAVGTNVNHYMNGATNGSGVISAATADGGTPVRIGSRDDTGTQMKGDIAEVLIYNRGLTESQRSTITTYLAGKYTVPFVSVSSSSSGTNGPSLAIAGKASTGFVLSWPASVTGFTLESSATLANPTWKAVPGVQNNQVTVTPSDAAEFYRLHKQ